MNKIYEIKVKKFIGELPELYPDYLIDYNTKTKTLLFTNKSPTKGEQWTVQIDTYNNINDLQQFIENCIEVSNSYNGLTKWNEI